ncbi:MAG: hypothetical protein ING75_07785 [Rhodocyclaceae bacterium]|nr:hypothetical protein [Rhodocyclaceae bacterium]
MRAFLLTFLILGTAPALAQERLVGTNIDVRTILDFKVSDAAVQKLLPPGWEIDPATSGPSAGANLRVAFVDNLAAHDATGKPVPPIRNLIFGIPVKKVGVPGALLLFAVLSPGDGGTYGASMKSTNVVERKIRHQPGGPTTVEESWELKAENGHVASLHVHYVRGVATRSRSEIRNYAQPKPEFFRIYRSEQGVDVVRGADSGTERLKKYTFKASGEKFSALFDGTEQLISLTSLPWYQREVYVTGP